jgi:peptide/nickel transport system substrate-binding protein
MPRFDDHDQTRRFHSGASSRRGLLKGAAALGLATPALRSLGTGAAPAPDSVPISFARYQADGSTLVIGLDNAPSDRDPHSQYDYRSTLVVRGVYETLIHLVGSATDQYEGRIAESWESNEDQSVWTFKIRPGVTFHNGDPCDAAAVKASYERLLAMNMGAVGVFSRFIADPEQMTTPDAGTIVFDCGKPAPLFEAAMAATYGPQVVNVKVAMANEEEGDFGNAWMRLNSEGAGTGPYIVTEADPATGVILERNEAYWGGWEGAHVDRVIVRVVEEPATMRQLVEAGEVDIMDRFSVQLEDVEALSQNPDLVVDSQDSTEVEYFAMAVAGPLATPEARKAMALAYPYQDVIDGVYLGLATQTPTIVAPPVRGFAEEVPVLPTDLEQARELLAQAGVAEGTELTAMLNTGADVRLAELFQPNLAELGITLTIEQVDSPTFTGIFYGDAPAEERPHFMRWSWWPDYNDAWNALQPTTSCDAWGSKGANGGFYCNEAFDEQLAKAKDASTLETYESSLAEAQRIIGVEDIPVIAIAQPKWTTVLNKSVQGFAFNPINLGTYDLHKLSKS